MSEQESRSIDDYFPVKATEFKSGVELPVTVYLYFTKNSHIMGWKKIGDSFDPPALKKLVESNIQNLYVHKSDRDLWTRYCTTPSPDERRIPDEAGFIATAMSSIDLNETERKNLTRVAGMELIREAGQNQTLDQKHFLKKTSEVLIALELDAKTPGLSLIWALAQADGQLVHGRNVASLSLAFALALGKNDKEILSELLAAALLHDLGLCYLNVKTLSHPLKNQPHENFNRYLAHVPHTLEIINQVLPKSSVRLRNMIQLHHEKFGPLREKNALNNYPSLIYSQILALAEMVENVSSGLFDGKKRPLRETFQYLFESEQASDFPDYFDPGVFLPIYQAVHDIEMDTILKSAKPVVKAYIDKHPLSRQPESDV